MEDMKMKNHSLSITLVVFILAYFHICAFAHCAAETAASEFSVCAVGDSITQGGSAFTSHRIALERRFSELGWSVEWKGTRVDASWGSTNPCEGYSGKNAEFIAGQYEAHAPEVAADVLLLHAGHNYNAGDASLSPTPMSEEDIVAAVTNAHARIIAAARAQNPNVIVLYAKVITSGGNRAVKYSYIPALNDAIAVNAAGLDTEASPVVVVDMADGWNYATDCVSDCVHPNDTGAAKMAAKWIAAFQDLTQTGKLAVSANLVVSEDMTLTADTVCDTVTVAEGATLNLNGYKLRTGTIDGKGTIMSAAGDFVLSQAGYELLSYVATSASNNDALKASVDTGYTPLLTDRVETKVRFGSLDTNQGIFTVRATTATNTFSCILSTKRIRFDLHATSPYTYHRAQGAASDTDYVTDADYEIVMDGGTGAYSVNGDVSATTLKSNPGDPAATPNMTFRLFVVATKGVGVSLPAKGCRMYYFRVYDKDGNLKLDMVPVRRTSDGKAGFYDRVANVFKTADALIAGPAQAKDLTAPGGACATPTTLSKGSAANLFNDNFTYTSDSAKHILATKGNLPLCVDYDFGEGGEVAVNMYRLHAGYSLRAPKKWTLFGSNDPAAFNAASDELWAELDSRDSQTDWTLGALSGTQTRPAECRTKFFGNVTPYRYYRLKVEKQNDETQNYLQLIQIEYFHVAKTDNPGELHLAHDFDLAGTTVALGGDIRVILDGESVAPPQPLPVVESCLVEAESFAEKGGWVVDPQFVEQMGSPYLLAHGKGRPVADAKTKVNIKPGRVRAYVRTRDWTPDWESEKPGRFQLSLGGETFPVTLGVAPATWGWVDAGIVEVGVGPQTLALHDLTGFEGRCDAIYLCPEDTAMPPDDATALAAWRAEMHGEAGEPEDVAEADFVVVGGGIAGTAAAIAAAEAGLNVAIVQDRPMLGGNASDEIRVLCCKPGSEYHWIVNAIKNGNPDNCYQSKIYDGKRMNLATSYPNLALHLGWRAYGVVTNAERKIVAVDVRNVQTGARRRFVAPVYCDATGDGWIAYWAGAAYMLGREAKDDFDEPNYAQDVADTSTMGSSLLWTTTTQEDDYVFPDVPWATKVSGTRSATGGNWHWETGLDPAEDTIDDAEMLRDRMFRAIYGCFWNAKQNSANSKRVFDWVPYVAGKRESRRIYGDYVVSERDVTECRQFEDAIGIATWTIDLHKPTDTSYIANNDSYKVSPWWMPYRALCCRDVPNLFLAGRCTSFTHVAFASSRVQNALGQQGVAVGFAASLCKKYGCLPRGIYQDAAKTAELQSLLNLKQADNGMKDYAWPEEEPPVFEHESVIVDNADATGVEISGAWTTSSSESTRIGESYLHSNKAASEDLWVRYTPEIPSNATYTVYLFWCGNESRASAVPVEIVYDGGVITNYVDMTKPSKKWNKIGEWPFAAGTSGSVRIMTAGAAGKYVIADAVKSAIVELSNDADQNGLPDAWERLHFLRKVGTDPNADPDGDGQSNRYEYVIGSDPNIVNQPFAIDGLSGVGAGAISLTWKGVEGRVYQVKRATEVNGSYENYGIPIVPDAEGNCSIEVQTSAAVAFFKIEVSVGS